MSGLNRRDFFGAAAGTLVAGTQVKVKGKPASYSCPFPDGECTCGGCGSDDGESEEWEAQYRDWYRNYKPELELGHSARWKIQRFPGAKWVAVHNREIKNYWGERGPIVHIELIEQVLTNCNMDGLQRVAG